jgi:hypothetical protein
MTGIPVNMEPRVGGKFKAWDGFASGVTPNLSSDTRIIGGSHASEFPDGSPLFKFGDRIGTS